MADASGSRPDVGYTFGYYRELIVGRLSALGYETRFQLLNASDFGVPQNRRRMFLFGVRGMRDASVAALSAPALTGSRRRGGTVRDVLARLGPAGTMSNPATCTARVVYARRPIMRASPYAGMLFNGAGRPIRLDAPAPTIAASAGGNKTHFVDEAEMFGGEPPFVEEYHTLLARGGSPRDCAVPSRLRRLTVRECMAFQTFPEDYIFEGARGSRYRQIGNAVPCALAEAVASCALALANVAPRVAAV